MSADVELLQGRLWKLEAKDRIEQRWIEYMHALDMARVAELLAIFAPDAIVDTMDSPPGSGIRTRLIGHDEIRPVYSRWSASIIRHHGANLSIDVDGNVAQMSALFLRTGRFEVLGGMYEGTWSYLDGDWYITYWRVATSFSWHAVGDEAAAFIEGLLSKGTMREGRPVRRGDASHPLPLP